IGGLRVEYVIVFPPRSRGASMVDSRIETLSWACSAGVFLVTLYLIRTRGFLLGGRPAWLAGMLLAPAWCPASTAALIIAPRSACALAILVGLLLEPCVASRQSHWFLSDLAVLLLTLTVLVSQAVARDFALLSPLDQFRAFVLPYVVGRLFLR